MWNDGIRNYGILASGSERILEYWNNGKSEDRRQDEISAQ